MTRKQWNALAAFIKREAQYAADEAFNRNDCMEARQRTEIEEEARRLFVSDFQESAE